MSYGGDTVYSDPSDGYVVTKTSVLQRQLYGCWTNGCTAARADYTALDTEDNYRTFLCAFHKQEFDIEGDFGSGVYWEALL